MRLLFFALAFSCLVAGKSNAQIKAKRTVIELQQAVIDSGTVDFAPLDRLDGVMEWKTISAKKKNGRLKLVFKIDQSVVLYSSDLFPKSALQLINPGDSISMIRDVVNKRMRYSGRGAVKIQLDRDIFAALEPSSKLSNPSSIKVASLEDFYEWNAHLDKNQQIVLNVLNKHRNTVDAQTYNFLKSKHIVNLEKLRLDKFWFLKGSAKKLGVSDRQLCSIFDSVFYSEPAKWMRTVAYGINETVYFYLFNRAEIYRKFNFNSEDDRLRTDENRRRFYYPQAKLKYKGYQRENLLMYILTAEGIKEVGPTPLMDSLLNDYYTLRGFPEAKQYVKEFELKARRLKIGAPAPDFTLTDIEGKPVGLKDYSNKLVILDFWFTGCKGCIQLAPAMRKVEAHFKDNPGVAFLSICVDDDAVQWKKSVAEGKYTSGTAENLYTQGKGYEHEILKNYNVHSYPTVYLIDAYGKIANNPGELVKSDGGKALIKSIEEQLVVSNDGPYLKYGPDGKVKVYSVKQGNASIQSPDVNGSEIHLTVATDSLGKTFNVSLQSKMDTALSEHARPEKLIAFSDIEGNFDALRKLLQVNQVIDQDFNWTFENGQLVFAGDMFDRGDQVTECLWLIYKLEKEAAVAGGKVHFVLGNHEVMNLSGHHGYAKPKYLENAAAFQTTYAKLFGEDSELGRWLRSKNVIQKIGNLLFMHGGFSEEMLGLSMNIAEINHMARPYLDRDTLAMASSDRRLSTIYGSKTSPFWYRNYYLDATSKSYTGGKTVYRTSMATIDQTLDRYKVRHIVTGHTIIADTISVLFGNRVINTDVPHAKGKSEALLIEGNAFYRVNDEGDRKLLFRDPEEKDKIKK